MPLPPLLSERPPALRAPLIVIPALLAGFATGATLGLSAAAWTVANLLAALGGIGGGFEHESPAAGARRGALGGLAFGLALVLADALVVDQREATIADPAILQIVVTTAAGALLGALGGLLRARAMRRRAAAATA
jgi:4-amino-4-deoxy-L-arabinose transferase-like glycosyltransferase